MSEYSDKTVVCPLLGQHLAAISGFEWEII